MKNLVLRLERKTALNNNHGYSIVLMLFKKIRILVIYLYMSFKYLSSIYIAKKVNREVFATKTRKSALIIGGGPSAGLMNVNAVLADQRCGELDVFAMNWYTHTNIAKSITPDYYVLSDPINRINSGKSFRGRRTEDLWDQLRVWSETKLIVPNFWMKQLRETSFKIGCYVDDRELLGFTNNVSILKPRGYCSMTAFKSIAAAIHLGYDTIYLVGFDSSTFKATVIDSKNQIFESNNNIADGPHTPSQILNKDFPGGMTDMLYAYAQVFFDVKKCFKEASVRNIQEDSYLDAFLKVETKYLKWN